MNIQKTILVVEDQAETADMFAEMLKLDGYQVLKSDNGLQALTVLRQYTPDAIILDMMIPGMPGLEVLKFIQDQNKLRHIPVIIVSAKAMLHDINKGISAGAASYLTKPISFTDLRREVSKVLINRH